MTREPDPVWEPGSAPADPFTAELERRLAPLADELDDILAELERAPAEPEVPEPEAPHPGGAVTLTLEPGGGPSMSPPAAAPERGWPWALAACVVLGFAVAVLVRAKPSALTRDGAGDRGSAAGQVAGPLADAVDGPSKADARVRIGVEVLDGSERPASVRAELRAHQIGLARCAVALTGAEPVDLRVELGRGGDLRVAAPPGRPAAPADPAQREAEACVRAALAGWRPRPGVRVDLQLVPQPTQEQSR